MVIWGQFAMLLRAHGPVTFWGKGGVKILWKGLLPSFPCYLHGPSWFTGWGRKRVGSRESPCRHNLLPLWQVSSSSPHTSVSHHSDPILCWNVWLSRMFFLTLILKPASLWPHLTSSILLDILQILSRFPLGGSLVPSTALYVGGFSGLFALLVTHSPGEICPCALTTDALPFGQHFWCSLARSGCKRIAASLNLDTIVAPVAGTAGKPCHSFGLPSGPSLDI